MSNIDTVTTDDGGGDIEIAGFRFKQAAFPFKEGVKLLGLATSTAYLLCSRGELHTFTLGGRRYISAAEIVRVTLKNSNGHENAVPPSLPQAGKHLGMGKGEAAHT